jgi:hypothetical protein
MMTKDQNVTGTVTVTTSAVVSTVTAKIAQHVIRLELTRKLISKFATPAMTASLDAVIITSVLLWIPAMQVTLQCLSSFSLFL